MFVQRTEDATHTFVAVACAMCREGRCPVDDCKHTLGSTHRLRHIDSTCPDDALGWICRACGARVSRLAKVGPRKRATRPQPVHYPAIGSGCAIISFLGCGIACYRSVTTKWPRKHAASIRGFYPPHASPAAGAYACSSRGNMCRFEVPHGISYRLRCSRR